MKRCPFCAEEIQDAAIVCRFCQRDLPKAAAPMARPLVPGVTVDSSGAVRDASSPSPQPGVVVRPAAKVTAAILLALVLGFLGLVILAVAISVTGVNPSPGSTAPNATSRKTGAAAPSNAPPPRPTTKLALLSSRGYESHGYFIVEGEIKNTSSESLENVAAVSSWYDGAGKFIASDDALIEYNPLLPGQTSPFKTMTRGNPEMKRFSVEFKHLFGRKLAHEDLSK